MSNKKILIVDDDPDIIEFLSHNLRKAGYEVCRFLKSSDDFREIPVIIVSAKGTDEDIQKGLALGADGYLPKPFAISSLLELIECFH